MFIYFGVHPVPSPAACMHIAVLVTVPVVLEEMMAARLQNLTLYGAPETRALQDLAWWIVSSLPAYVLFGIT